MLSLPSLTPGSGVSGAFSMARLRAAARMAATRAGSRAAATVPARAASMRACGMISSGSRYVWPGSRSTDHILDRAKVREV